MELSRVRLAADVGGTFTDVAAFDETTGELRLGKTLTTPARLVTGVENGVTKAGAQRRVDLRPVRPRTCDRLIADSDQLDVPGIKAPCGVVRAELRMLSSWLHGKSEDLIVPDPARGRCLPDRRARRVGAIVVTPVDTSAGALRPAESVLPDITAIACHLDFTYHVGSRFRPASRGRSACYRSWRLARRERLGRNRRWRRPACQADASEPHGAGRGSPPGAPGAHCAAAG